MGFFPDSPARGPSAPPSGHTPRALGLAALAFAALFAVYSVCTQAVMHSDGPRLFVSDGTPGTLHFLYSPTLAAWRALWEPLGLSRYFVTSALSSFSAALAVLCLYFATRRHATFGVAISTAILAATAPAVFFYATTIEIHAVMFGVFGFVALGTSRLLTRPTMARAVVVGALCGVGYLMHNTGALLPVIPIAMAIAFFGVRRQGMWLALILLVAAHVVVVVGGNVYFVVPNGQYPGGVFQGSIPDSLARPAAALTVLWQEWIWAFLPVSVWFLVAFRRPDLRRLALATTLMFVPYLGATFVLMAGYAPAIGIMYEKGAYLMPLIWPSAWLVAAATRSRLAIAVGVVVALAAAQVHVYRGVDHERNVAFHAGLAEASSGQTPFLLTGKWRDWEACLLAEPPLESRSVSDLGLYTPELQAQIFAIMEQDLRRRIESGQAVFVTERATRLLERCEEQDVAAVPARAILDWLAQTFELVPVDEHGFRGQRLMLR